MCAATVSAEPAGLLDARERGEDLGRHFLVELDVLLELRNRGARQDVHLALVVLLDIGKRRDVGGEQFAGDEPVDARAFDALDQHLDRAVRKLEQLQNRGDRADAIQVVGFWIVDVGLLLRDEHDALVGFHREVERQDRLLTSDEQRNHHVRVHDDVA